MTGEESDDGVHQDPVDDVEKKDTMDTVLVAAKTSSYEEVGQHDGQLIDFLKDEPHEMTYARRIAHDFMQKYKWYNPNLDASRGKPVTEHLQDDGGFRSLDGYPISHSKVEEPSLYKAWAYFEHVALPRYILEKKETRTKSCVGKVISRFSKGDQKLERAEPGENEVKTKLYDPIFTPHNQLGDFGLGIGLYFSTIRAMTLITIVAGFISFPLFTTYSSEDYGQNTTDLELVLWGSAVCSDYDWVPCPTCDDDSHVQLITTNTSDVVEGPGTILYFAKVYNCEGATRIRAYANYAACIFVVLAAIALNYYLKVKEVAFDEDEQTAQDYSITIDNPPEDATEPEEWRKYFEEQLEHKVAGITVTVDNELLINALIKRREMMRRLELSVEPGTSLDIVTLAGIAAKQLYNRKWYETLMAPMAPGLPEYFGELVMATAKVQGLAQNDYPATEVMVTFETEKSQREVLKAMDIGNMNVSNQNKKAVPDPKYLFRGETVLAITEAEEPDTIMWESLETPFSTRMKQQMFTNFFMFCVVIAVAFCVIAVEDSLGFVFVAYFIALCNSLVPFLVIALTKAFEAHPTAGDFQASLFFKIGIFRMFTTAVIITIVTQFENILIDNTQGLGYQVYLQFRAEVTTTALLQILDIDGHLARHYFAPREKSQDAMNLNMRGSVFELAERYTILSKNVFLAFWYCAVYPAGLFWCAACLQVSYFLDRISLMRTWRRPPRLGTSISELQRKYILPVSVLAMIILSSYYWSGFPFDNLCPLDTVVPSEYVGTWTTEEVVEQVFDSSTFEQEDVLGNVTISVEATDTTYYYCKQDFLRMKGFAFPFTSAQQPEGHGWMTDEQEEITNLFGWTALGCLVVIFLALVWQTIVMGKEHFFGGGYEPAGDDQDKPFSTVESISLYIPQINSDVFSYPLLACNVDEIDKDMLDWTDPEHGHAYYDLTKDAQALLRDFDISKKVVFARVAHYPPRKDVETQTTPFEEDMDIVVVQDQHFADEEADENNAVEEAAENTAVDNAYEKDVESFDNEEFAENNATEE